MGFLPAAKLYAHTRADVWRRDLPEQGTTDPKDGRRIHIIVHDVRINEQELESVTVNGQNGLALTDDLTYFDWFRAHSDPMVGQMWLSFHTRNEAWIKSSSLNVTVVAKNGTVVAMDQVPVHSAIVTLSYVTMRKGGKQALLHLHGSTRAGSVSSVL